MNEHPNIPLLTRLYDPQLDRVTPLANLGVQPPYPLAMHRLRVELEVVGHTERVRQLLDLLDDCLVSGRLSVAALDLEARCDEDLGTVRGCRDWFTLVMDEWVGDLQLLHQMRGSVPPSEGPLLSSQIWQRWSRFLVSHQS